MSDIAVQTFVILFRPLRSPAEDQLGNFDQKKIWRRGQTASSFFKKNRYPPNLWFSGGDYEQLKLRVFRIHNVCWYFILFTKVHLRDENQLDKDANFIGMSFSCHGLLSSECENSKRYSLWYLQSTSDLWSYNLNAESGISCVCLLEIILSLEFLDSWFCALLLSNSPSACNPYPKQDHRHGGLYTWSYFPLRS